MEDRVFPYGISIDASQLHAHMHFQASSLAVEPASPLPPPHPLLLHSQHDPPELVSSPSLPLSYTHKSCHPSNCAQESCATTDSISVHDEHNSHAHKTEDKVHIHRSFDGIELNLRLGSGGHQEHGLNSRVTSETAEHSASSISELDRSSHGMADAEFTHSAPLPAFKSSEGTLWEDVISGGYGRRLAAAAKSDQTVGDFDQLCPTAKGHSVFQARLHTCRAFPISTGALCADHEAFPLAVGAAPADGAFVASHEEKVFFCKFCDRRFHSSQALGGHQNAHKRERLVARSSPVRFGPPAVFCAVPGAMSFELPSCSMQQHLGGAGRDRCPVPYPLSASMCRNGSISPLPQLQDTATCRDNFEAPLLTSMPSTKLMLDCSPSSNLYMENRSLGIKAHSLVHKPSTGHTFAPRMGHLKAINVIPAPDRASATHHGWSRTASMDAQPGVARCLAPAGQDHHAQHKNLHHGPTRFSLHMMKDETAGLLRHHHRQCMPFHESYVHPLANHSNPVKPCIKSGFLYELDSSSSIVDLALHL